MASGFVLRSPFATPSKPPLPHQKNKVNPAPLSGSRAQTIIACSFLSCLLNPLFFFTKKLAIILPLVFFVTTPPFWLLPGRGFFIRRPLHAWAPLPPHGNQ